MDNDTRLPDPAPPGHRQGDRQDQLAPDQTPPWLRQILRPLRHRRRSSDPRSEGIASLVHGAGVSDHPQAQPKRREASDLPSLTSHAGPHVTRRSHCPGRKNPHQRPPPSQTRTALTTKELKCLGRCGDDPGNGVRPLWRHHNTQAATDLQIGTRVTGSRLNSLSSQNHCRGSAKSHLLPLNWVQCAQTPSGITIAGGERPPR